MADYRKFGWGTNLFAISSLSVKNGQQERGVDFDVKTEMQTNHLRSSRMIKISNLSTTDATGVVDGNTVTLTTTLTPTVAGAFTANDGSPYIAIYEGTSANGSQQIYPVKGGSITTGDYEIMSGFDERTWLGTNSVFKVSVRNVAAGTVNMHFRTQWNYIQNNA